MAEELPREAIASIPISPEDVVQGSIQRFRLSTNKFVVRWQNTEEGAKKMRAFSTAHNAGAPRPRHRGKGPALWTSNTVIPVHSVFVGVHFENVFRAVRVVLLK